MSTACRRIFPILYSAWAGPREVPSIAHSLKGSRPPGLIGLHGSLGPGPQVCTPNSISVGPAVLEQVTVVANRQTHRPRYICINIGLGCIYHCVHAIRPKIPSRPIPTSDCCDLTSCASAIILQVLALDFKRPGNLADDQSPHYCARLASPLERNSE